MFQKNKACQIFRKTNICYPLIRACAYQGKEMFVFRKTWHALFPFNTRFKIRAFALSPMNYHKFLKIWNRWTVLSLEKVTSRVW